MDLEDIKLVVANKYHSRQIQKQLYDDFGINKCIVFKLEEEVETYNCFCGQTMTNECIIEYEGGLGNQMFQYAFAQNFASKNLYTTGDMTSYYNVGRRKFLLTSVFPNISIPECNIGLKEWYKKNKEHYMIEQSILSVEKKETDIDILQKQKGYFKGYWQSIKYVQPVEKQLRQDFMFFEKNDLALYDMMKEMKKVNSVSVHIRRGDYLEEKNKKIYGNICTEEYYIQAMLYVQKRVEKPVFYFFSNDIEWVKQKFKKQNAVYISTEMFEDYEDWYDMYLMSVCKHNVIANSTFSWWGAWLNQNSNKIIITPSKWINGCECKDLYPDDWIKI